MGRAPCCDKANVKKGPWSPEEDATLKSYIDQNGTGGNWIALPQKIGLKRCGKSCRLRWLNYLRPNIKHGGFSEEEDNVICSLYISIGSRWSIIAAQLPGRTDNDIKNYWNTRLKKKLLGKQRKEQACHARREQIKRQNQFNNNNNNNTTTSSPNFVVDHHHHQNHQVTSEQGFFELASQTPYWPDLQSLVADQTVYNDTSEASIKNLIVKLGGKFSDDQQQQQQQQEAIVPSSFDDHHQSVFQLGLESLQAELSELINYRNYQQDDVVILDHDEYYAYVSNNNSEGFYEIGSSTATSSASLDSASSSLAYDYAQNVLPHHHHHQEYYSCYDQDHSRSYFGNNNY